MWRDISIWLAETGAIFAKEWRTELRTRYALNTVGLFAFTTLVITTIALGPSGTSQPARPFVVVLLWVILLFAASAGLPRTFVHEEESRTAIGLRLMARPSCLFCGKALYNLVLIFSLELLVTPLFVGIMQLPIASPRLFILSLVAGGVGLALGSTLTAAMVAQAQAKGALFAVLAFPILLPLLKFVIDATLAATTDQTLLMARGEVALNLAILYDGTLMVAALMLFPPIWNP